MEHDFAIYTFIQQLTNLINNSKLSFGDLNFIFQSVQESIVNNYNNNIKQYMIQNNLLKTEEYKVPIDITLTEDQAEQDIQIDVDHIIKQKGKEESGQE